LSDEALRNGLKFFDKFVTFIESLPTLYILCKEF
jgi:hypothetical protein